MSSLPSSPLWQFWIDRGGTFTDIVGKQPDGQSPFVRVEIERASKPQFGELRQDGHHSGHQCTVRAKR
jgi:N-methylhydantoinase A/oxoprolinase/acetone carboxylase beta subunit